MNAQHTPGPLVCWRLDGTPKIVHVPTRESVLIGAAEEAADTLQQLRGVLNQAANDIESRDEAYAETLRHFADVMCRGAATDLLAAIAKATGAAA